MTSPHELLFKYGNNSETKLDISDPWRSPSRCRRAPACKCIIHVILFHSNHCCCIKKGFQPLLRNQEDRIEESPSHSPEKETLQSFIFSQSDALMPHPDTIWLWLPPTQPWSKAFCFRVFFYLFVSQWTTLVLAKAVRVCVYVPKLSQCAPL